MNTTELKQNREALQARHRQAWRRWNIGDWGIRFDNPLAKGIAKNAALDILVTEHLLDNLKED